MGCGEAHARFVRRDITKVAPVKVWEAAEVGVATPLYDPSSKALDHYYSSLRRSAEGTKSTRIMFFGASHTASDCYTRPIRHRLQLMFGDAGPGFAVPASPWRDYNHRDLNISYSKDWTSHWVRRGHRREDGLYGMAGVTFSSSNPESFARLETAKKSRFGKMAGRFEIFYWAHPQGGDLQVYLDDLLREEFSTSAKEAGPGFRTYTVPDGPHAIEVRPKGTGEVILFGIATDRDKPGVVMDNLGINGARARDLLEWNKDLFVAHIQRRRPDLMVLAYGTNESGDDLVPMEAYKDKLVKTMDRFRLAAPQSSCLLIGPSDYPVKVDRYGPRVKKRVSRKERKRYNRFWRRRQKLQVIERAPRARQDEIIAVQKEVAVKFGCAFWDWRAAQGGALSMLTWRRSRPLLAQKDYLHFTRAGYEKISLLLWDALMGGYVGPVRKE